MQKNRGDNMSKTITLRLKDEIYNIFLETAKAENRSISNLIETAALNKIREQQFVDDVEMAEILSNQDLLRRIKEGSNEAQSLKGRFVE
jgi:predicted CopG family antitoxin